MPDEFEVAERGFGTELFDGMPEHIRTLLEECMDLIQDVVEYVGLAILNGVEGTTQYAVAASGSLTLGWTWPAGLTLG